MIDFPELIKKNVEGLTDDQVAAIAKVTQNAMAERVAEIHRQYDQDLKELTGKDKPAGVKTYDWMKAEFGGLKEQAEKAAQEANQAAQEKIAQLESQIEKAKKGGAGSVEVERLQKELNDAKDLAEGLKSQYEKQLSEWQEKYSGLNQEYRKAQIKQEIVGMQFRSDIPESLRELAINNAVQHVLSLNSETDDNGNVIYRNADGKLLTNPDKALAPFTTGELLQKQLADVLDKGRKQTGAGTKDGKAGDGKNLTLALNAKTQREAMEQITQHLFAVGIPQTDKRHQEFIDQAWKDNKVAELPAQ